MGAENLLVLQPPKTSLMYQFPCLLNLPSTNLECSASSSPSLLALRVWGSVSDLTHGTPEVWNQHTILLVNTSITSHNYPFFGGGAAKNISDLLSFFSFFFWPLCNTRDFSSLTRDQTQAPLRWKHRVLTTGPPGKPPRSTFLTSFR